MPVNPRGSSWQATVTLNGRRERKSFKTEVEAKAWEARTMADMLEGKAPDRGEKKDKEHTLQELYEYVFKARWKGLDSEEKLSANGREVVAILGKDRKVSTLNKMDALAVKEHFIKRNRSNSTINRKLAALSVLVNEAVELDWLGKSFKMGMFKESQSRKRLFSPEEINAMLKWCDRMGETVFKDYILLSLDTGLRQGEILKIRQRDAYNPTLWTYKTKNNTKRGVPLTPRAKEIIDRLAAEAELPEEKLMKLSPSQIRERWAKLRTDMGMVEDLEFTPHVFRHNFISTLLHLGADIISVKELAGHKNVTTTQGYAKTTEDWKAAAIAKLAQAHVADVAERGTEVAETHATPASKENEPLVTI